MNENKLGTAEHDYNMKVFSSNTENFQKKIFKSSLN